MKLSVVIITKNEEKNIGHCIEQCSFADEIIIVDDFSKDNTINTIKGLKNENVEIYQHALDSDFSAQRNFGLEKAKGDWILFIDADEALSDNLVSEIKSIVDRDLVAGCFIKRVDFLWNRKITHGELLNFKLLRLAKKDAGIWKGKVHEEWNIKGETVTLRNELVHKPHVSIRDFILEINFYTTIRAKELFEKGVRTNFLEIIFYPKAKFVLNYFIKFGILDGAEGLLLSLLMSLHSFLVRAKLYLLWKKRTKNV